MIDDSELFHGTYDPIKAREYYLKTRKLKGRKKGSSDDLESPKSISSGKSLAPAGKPGQTSRSKTQSRQAELKAQKEALKKRLDRLKDVLEELVEAAKKRSGGDPNKSKSGEKDKAPETPVDKADRNKAEKKSKPETASQKKERAKAAKEAYEKENPNSLSTDVDILREQIADIQKKIADALSSAKALQEKAGKKEQATSFKTINDGPRGR